MFFKKKNKSLPIEKTIIEHWDELTEMVKEEFKDKNPPQKPSEEART